MAFNPFTNFRKYQKVWMPAILLLCMVTFVLCSGAKGDLSDLILGIFGGRQGTAIAKVGGHNLYRKDIDELKEQRNAVNEFMKRAADFAIRKIDSMVKDDPNLEKMTLEERQKWFTSKSNLTMAQAELKKRALRTRYFDSGVKLDELVHFKVWLHEADRLGINLVPKSVKQLFSMELFGIFTEGVPPDHPNYDAIIRDVTYSIIREMEGRSQQMPIETLVSKGLTDEFRVRLAQRTLALADPALERGALTESRIPLSPAMLWDSFVENRKTFDVALIPVEVADFVKDVGEPTEAELKTLFQAHAKEDYDPSSPTPGFKIPQGARIGLVVGDPESPKYKQWSKTLLLLQASPPVWAPSSPWSILERFGSGPLALREALEKQYAHTKSQRGSFRDQFLTTRLNEADVYWTTAAYLARKHPEAAAGWIAAYAQPANIASAFIPQLGYYAVGAGRHAEDLGKAMAIEAKGRVPLYAPLCLAGTSGSLLDAMGLLGTLEAHYEDRFLPLDLVQEPMKELIEYAQAKKWVAANMLTLREKLEDKDTVGKMKKFERELERNLETMGLELQVTKGDLYDRYTIDKAPELQPLRKAYKEWYLKINSNESRDLNRQNALQEGDFYKLFFDPTQKFSVSGSTYRVKSWPPVVTPKKVLGTGTEPAKAPKSVDLFLSAEKPILFWKMDDRLEKVPESLEPVKEAVVKAWKMDKAREPALKKAKELAKVLQNSQVGYGPVLALQPHIPLKDIAPLYTKEPPREFFKNFPGFGDSGIRDYEPFKVPKDAVNYPREDMNKELLDLAGLKKPLEIGVKNVDDLNKELFGPEKNPKTKALEKTDGVVQVLTNKPRTTFYVACVLPKRQLAQGMDLIPGLPKSDSAKYEFHSALRYASPTQSLGKSGIYVDNFVDRAFQEASKEHMQAMMKQLMKQSNSEILIDAAERTTFDLGD